jgi:hypothetical protein
MTVNEKVGSVMTVGLSVLLLVMVSMGSSAFAQSQGPNPQLINFDERRAVALARIKNVATAPTEAQESTVLDGIREINSDFANDFNDRLTTVTERFDQKLRFYQSFSESKVLEVLDSSYAEVGFALIEENYSNELIEFSAESIADIYLTGKILIDEILFDEYISMLPAEARAPLQLELKRMLSAHPSVPNSSPDTSRPDVDTTVLRTTVAALVARRLAASSVGRRLLSGLGKRLLKNAVGRGAIAVLAPNGEFCGPAVLLCEAGVFVGAVGWESYQYREKVVEAVQAGLQQQATDLRNELLSPTTINPMWDVIATEATEMLETYRGAVEQIMLETFDDLIAQNADFMAGDLPDETDDESRVLVFRQMATTYGDSFLQYTWAQRYAFAGTMDDRARALLDTHGSAVIDLFLVHPQMLARVVRSGASDSLLSAILQSERPQTSLTQTAEAIRRTGRISPDLDAVLADILRLNLMVQPGEIDPQGIRLATSNAAQLRTMATESPSGGVLYARVIQGVYSPKALDFVLSSENPGRIGEVFGKLPRQTVSELSGTESVSDLDAFISAFPVEEGTDYLASAEAGSYLTIFRHRSGGPKAVRAWAEFVDGYARPPEPWMHEQFLWIADQGYDPSAISLPMINTAYDTSDHPEFWRKALVWWANVTGWAWGTLLFSFVLVFAVLLFLPRLFRGILKRSQSSHSDITQKPQSSRIDKTQDLDKTG